MERADVERWVASYERAWRSPGTDLLAEIFTPDVSYLPSPWGEPVEGIEALRRFWDAERDGPGEAFTMTTTIVAVEGNVAVVRVGVDYHEPPARWRDLWVVGFAGDGRCRTFEEWPFAPEPAAGV